ncbi:hypothetical protein [Paenibacillus fonticola]|uniref:hypothetical protein n=1 Tax=Paenibacillus fonticola TaxID=379896 RepID=UPI0003800231|nr:hypothetical protein [Paenibacillus fonticola]
MDKLNFDEKILKKRIQDRILFKLENHFNTSDLTSENQEDMMLKPLIESHNILDLEFYSHRKFFGKFIIFTKKLFRKILHQIFMKQIHFNQKIIDHFFIIERKLIDKDLANKEIFKSISMSMVDDIVDECKIAIQEVVCSNVESIRNYYESELQISINEQIREQAGWLKEEANQIREEAKQISEETSKQISQQISTIKKQLYGEIKSSLFRDLAVFEKNSNIEESKYHLLLMALRENPENLDLEDEVIAAFESMNKSRLNTNDTI